MRKIHPLFIIFIAVTILASFFVTAKKIVSETKQFNVETAVNYYDWKQLIDFQDTNSLKKLKQYGITSVILPLETLSALEQSKDISIFQGSMLFNLQLISNLNPKFKVNPSYTYIVSKSDSILKDIKKKLELYGIPGNLHTNPSLLEIPKAKETIINIQMGFNEDLIKTLNINNFLIILSIDNTAEPTFSQLPDSKYFSAVLFNSPVIFNISETARKIKEGNFKIAKLEFEKNKDVDIIAKQLGGSILTAHVIPDKELASMPADKAVQRFARAVIERRINILYIKPFVHLNTSQNLEYIQTICSALKAKGFMPGESSVPKTQTGSFHLMLISLGIIAVIIITINEITHNNFIYNRQLLLYALSFISCVIFIMIGQIILLKNILALCCALCVPLLAIIWTASKIDSRGGKDFFWENFKKSAWLFLLISLISIVSGIIISAILSDALFFQRIEQFKGIKIALILPSLLFLYYSLQQNADLKKYLNTVLSLKQFLLISISLICISAVFLLIAIRSGNTGNFILFGEEKTRFVFEQVLAARPRFKEFLFGHPLLITGLFLYIRNLKNRDRFFGIILISLGIFGQTSIINTFCHVHTPFLFSLLRTFNGIWIGIIIGTIAAIFINNYTKRAS